MNKNGSFFKSLKCAFGGLLSALRTERNLRFDTAAAVSVSAFAYAWGLSRGEWCALLAIIGLVLSSEIINTAIEKTVDLVCKDYNELAGAAKDAAAAAPLISAVIACITAAVLFADLDRIYQTLIKIVHTPRFAVPALAALCVDVLLLAGGRKGIKN